MKDTYRSIMYRNKINFVTGETYTLAELFSGNRRIIIPDLQRDYCWGGVRNPKTDSIKGELVRDFIQALISQFGNNDRYFTLNLGLFYGYEMPANHIQLCDGQQRLTTLYLLLGMLNKRVGKFRQYLISDYEYSLDDREPYLQYAIRESSLYFLSDLVCRFFIENSDAVKCIRDAEWYFRDYDYDPSIGSILLALESIESILKDEGDAWCQDFGNWLLHGLTFMYFDMETRSNGEETFVVINTTGEPLSATENLKPLVINSEINKKEEDLATKWERIETWFWRNRRAPNDTADVGFSEFLRWISIIEYTVGGASQRTSHNETEGPRKLAKKILKGEEIYKFPYDDISFDTIYKYWQALKLIVGENRNVYNFEEDLLSPKNKKIEQKECFVLLPLLRFVYNQGGAIQERQCLRVYNFFKNLIRIDNVQKSVNDLVSETLDLVEQIADSDITSLVNVKDEFKILSKEEIRKLEILRDSDCREEVEELFWSLQAQDLWDGEILPIIEWASHNGEFDFDLFRQYTELLDRLFSGKVEYEDLTQTLRRCIIVCLKSYEPIARGAYRTFGWLWSEWKKFLSQDCSQIKAFLDYLLKEDALSVNKGCDELLALLERYINEHIDPKEEYSEFAKDDYLLSFTNDSGACDIIWEANDWKISTSGSTVKHTAFISRRNAYILKSFEGGYENRGWNQKLLKHDGWTVWYWDASKYELNCIVLQYKNIKLDIRFLSKSNSSSTGVLRINLKDTDNNTDLSAYPKLLEVFGCSKDQKEEVVKEVEFDTFDPSKIKEELEKLMTEVTNSFL